MAYTITDIEKIAGFKSWTNEQKIDELLRIDCSMYARLGTDSTQSERSDVKSNSKKIYKLIKSIDEEVGNLFLTDVDKK